LGILKDSPSGDGEAVKINVDLTHAQTNPTLLNQHYHLTQPFIHLHSHLQLVLSPQGSHSHFEMQSDVMPLAF